MKVVMGMATMNSRKEVFEKTIKSLDGQYDEIFIYNNDEHSVNYTDNAKFLGLTKFESNDEPFYYFCVDDDIIYPKTYVKDMIKAIEKYNCIVTHHGRKLIGKDRHYYRGHEVHHCLRDVTKNQEIDVAGTGVCAFRTDYFNPSSMNLLEHFKMSDVIFSLEAAVQGKRIMVLEHKEGYLQDAGVKIEDTIQHEFLNNCLIQTKLCNDICTIKGIETPENWRPSRTRKGFVTKFKVEDEL